MPQSLSYLLVHLVFSTKDRRPWLSEAIQPEVHAYLALGLRASDNACVRIGGTADHVHLAFYLGRTQTVSQVVERLKVSSAKWIKTKGPEFAVFRWQRGYADFQGEMRAIFAQYGVTFDEAFIWD